MKYNFDEIIDRSNTDSSKLENLKSLFGREDLIPLWVADMDFKSPPAITEALMKRVEHGLFGYTIQSEPYFNSIIKWLESRHKWKVNKDDIIYVPGVVKGFAFAIDEFTEHGDNIIIQPPVYHPFRIVSSSLGRNVVNNPLLEYNGKYRMDFDGLRKIVSEKQCKMLILCNPHNPAGRVWSPKELEELAGICYDNNIIVVSDEIHSDMALPGFTHTPFAKVSPKAENNCITLMAPSKTFNIAGIVSSFAIITNKEIRDKYLSYIRPRGLDEGTLFAYTATRIAYDECVDWLDQMLEYVQGNVNFVDSYLKKNIPQIKAMLPEASFLVWLDCRSLKLSQRDLVKLFVEEAGLALNDGTVFGQEGEGFMRLNVGTSRLVLEKALENLKNAVNK
ncbi:MAG: PatB family C-S lyase [Fermentimonas sp.]|jgi:cystathionine beta-lyase|nr:PatB family C-S lyase [Fermentimonas sp.]NLC85778.1 putative C-S lyase [Bacteroidales bacterium]HBT85594.1 cystathionine beta-lyase [Porphyromonadaceae bacterium]MDD2930114.1 PatB family C-S lyase [Fermentimonas sp.]MDD3187907.1 PatB family C-S lyase [Fermentimonas sp.]